jgi:SAM-dependent methyltransferase
MTDSCALRDDQYRTSNNLNARARLHQFSTARVNWFDWVFDHFLGARLADDASILDVGGGPGAIWKHNIARIPAGWQILHTDFSPGMVDEARMTVGRAGSIFEVAEAESLHYSDGAFDAVIANHMLYHVPDKTIAVREFARVLKPNGHLFATTNGENGMAEIRDLINAFNSRGRGTLEPWPRLSFTLESGPVQLSACFHDISVRDHDNMLAVTEAEPLAAYIMSRGKVSEMVRGELRAFLKQTLIEVGTLRLHPRAGMLVARKR